jgi:hypothetical protein
MDNVLGKRAVKNDKICGMNCLRLITIHQRLKTSQVTLL